MRLRYVLISFFFNAVFAVILALLASCSAPQDIDKQLNSSPEVKDSLVEQVAFQVDSSSLVSATMELVESQETPMQNGLELLNSNCVGCHNLAWFGQTEKSRAEWEKGLERMEAMGVNLSDAEKALLLDYLTAPDKPGK
jgi:mono/diheme cytochrome c family protein